VLVRVTRTGMRVVLVSLTWASAGCGLGGFLGLIIVEDIEGVQVACMGEAHDGCRGPLP
jgi:hypothetical protein